MAPSKFLRVALLPVVIGACDAADDNASVPGPAALTREAIGYYCNMIVLDHQGPKAQIFLKGEEAPIWFSSVRDAVVFTKLPEEPKSITAIYVNDMTRATWATPEPDTWMDAKAARYVIGSSRRGGMGALETVPFATTEAAESFAATHGGHVVAFEQIPAEYIFAPATDDAAHASGRANHGKRDTDD